MSSVKMRRSLQAHFSTAHLLLRLDLLESSVNQTLT